MARVTSFRLCSRAPLIVMWSIGTGCPSALTVLARTKHDKCGGGGGHQPAVLTLHPALGHAGPAAAVQHSGNPSQALAYSPGGDEAHLQVEAEVPLTFRQHRAHGPAHGAVRQ